MEEYINSLEENGNPMSENEWREWIEKEIADIKSQNPDIPEDQLVDIDEVIKRLDEDGYVK